jgi:tRNA pseudouridine55 synthase
MWWKKALDMVRNWEEFEMKKRKSTIYEIEILDYNYPDITIRAIVSAWTYIRSIAFDLWYIIWAGWYIKDLRRTKIWKLDIIDSIKLDNFEIDKNLDIKKLFPNNDFITLENEILLKVNNWLKFKTDLPFEQNKDLFVINWEDVTNIIRIEEGILKPQKKI